MALTDTALKALRPRDKTYTVTDDRGLYVEGIPQEASSGVTATA